MLRTHSRWAPVRELGFTSTLGSLHDVSGQLKPLDAEQQSVYQRGFRTLRNGLFSFAHFGKIAIGMLGLKTGARGPGC